MTSAPKEQVYAVCRYDSYMADSIDAFTIVKVMRFRTSAEDEEVRLNALNADKGSRYFVLATRLIGE